MAESGPYLSLVVTARNDNHGGNLLRRMQIFVDGWIAQSRRHNLPSELIVVEWNPPAEKPPLWQDLKWPQDTSPCEVRFIEVPAELHRRYAHAAALPLYQMIAKNVGIRRARGRFILASNIDILFSDELVRFLAQRNLRADRMYRIDRHDVMSDVPVDATIEEQLAYCESHLLRVNARHGTFPLTPDGRRALAKRDIASPESNISLGRGWFAAERWSDGEVFRWIDREAEIDLLLPDIPNPVLRLEVEPGPSAGERPVQLEIFEEGQTLVTAQIEYRSELRIALPLRNSLRRKLNLHVTGGDFPLDQDPRTLNLRVLSCGWAHTINGKGVTLRRVGDIREVMQIWRQLQGLIGRIATEGPNVTLTVPDRYRRMAAFYVGWGGVTGLLTRAPLNLLRRFHFRKRAALHEDVFDEAAGVRGGLGWFPREHYRGEVFRWANPEGEILLPPTSGNSATLLLQIEPGPGVDHKPFELLVKNQEGVVIATRRIKRLSFVRLAIPRNAMHTEVFTLCAANGGMEYPGDRRILNFRLYWCGVEQTTFAEARCPVLLLRQNQSENFTPVAIAGSTELIVAAPSTVPASLYLDIAEQAGAPDSLLVFGPGEDIIASSTISAPQSLALALPLRAGRTCVFRIGLTPPGSSIARARLTFSPPPARTRRANITESPARDSMEPQAWPGVLADPEHSPPARIPPAHFLHTNGCGDFTLLAREKWLDLRAYPEFDLFSMNIDSVFCYAAHYGGATEELLADPMRIYHIEHGTGSGWTPEGEAQLFERIRAKGLGFISNAEVVSWGAQMRRMGCPLIFNRENWGLADLELVEGNPAPPV